MNKIKTAFDHGKAFIAFLTCGDPDLETTAAAVRDAAANGADLIELGIPFSDPTAEGPVIQGANLRALKGGVTTDKIFALVEELRKDVTIPLVFMTYANVVFSYGTDRFLARAAEVGVDGIILPDVPYEEKEEFAAPCRAHGLDFISLIAPTSEHRIAAIAREAEGFLYLAKRYTVPISPAPRVLNKFSKDIAVYNLFSRISGQDEDLGQQTGSFAEKYTVTDVEGDNVVVTEFVDDKQIRSYQATLGQEETIELSRENWLVLANGDHQLRVEAVDGNFATSVRVWNFSKKETVIAFQFAQPEETDARATKILITPTWHIEGSVAKVEACNNAFDASPAWEDITAQVAINRVYNFLNQSKTAEKWGVNVRFTIEKNEGYEGEVSISGFGGAYE